VKRLDSLTSLRFFAAFAVLALHLSGYLPLVPAIEHASRLGYVGVGFFFTLSGFVLVWSSRPGDTPRAFYIRRFARVWPAHAVMTFAVIPLLLIQGDSPLWAALPFVLLLLQAWIPNGAWLGAFNTQSWSLSCEAFFYAAFPLLVVAAGWPRRRVRNAAAAVAAAAALVALAVVVATPDAWWGYLLYVNPMYRVAEFALGMAVAIAVGRGWRPRWRVWHAAVLVVAIYVFVTVAAPRDSTGSVPLFVADLALLPGFLALIAACAWSDLQLRRSMLRHRSLVVLGEWSFALYLVHVFVIKAAWLLFADAGWSRATWTAVAAVVALLSIGCAGTLYSVVERPVERYIRTRYASRRRPDHQPASASARSA
jgi:peptidoglycan/LPS O-acetylase OafA/YrhL